MKLNCESCGRKLENKEVVNHIALVQVERDGEKVSKEWLEDGDIVCRECIDRAQV